MTTENIERPQDELKAGPIAIAGIVGAILTFALIVALSALFLQAQSVETYHKSVRQTPAELRRLRSNQIEKLNGYGWVDREKGIVSVPIERAMELLVEEAKPR